MISIIKNERYCFFIAPIYSVCIRLFKNMSLYTIGRPWQLLKCILNVYFTLTSKEIEREDLGDW